MTKTLKIALTVSLVIHLTTLLMRMEPEPFVEANLTSLQLRLETYSKSTLNSESNNSPKITEDKTDTTQNSDNEINQNQTESPETLIAEETVNQSVPEKQNNAFENQKINSQNDFQAAIIDAFLPDNIEPDYESTSESTAVVVTENPAQTTIPIQTIKPVLPPILEQEPKEALANV